MKKRKEKKETAEEFRRKLLANPNYLKSLDEAVEIILEGEKGGRWKTLEEIEELKRRGGGNEQFDKVHTCPKQVKISDAIVERDRRLTWLRTATILRRASNSIVLGGCLGWSWPTR